jgi:hypothetical protein
VKNSSEAQIVQIKPEERLQVSENIVCIHYIFSTLHRHLSSGEIPSLMAINMGPGIHQVSSSQKVLTVSHVLFCQYAAMPRLCHIQYEDGNDFLEKFFVYRDDLKRQPAVAHR